MKTIKQKIKKLMRTALPLSLRKYLCVMISRQKWIEGSAQYWWTRELLRDFAERDSSGYHRYLWSNHLGYAESYDIDKRFGEENIKESRKIFFTDLGKHFFEKGINPQKDIKSVLEVGCSLGYQLRYLETVLFTGASELDGIDIDGQAIESGSRYLKHCNSRIRLRCSDMGNIDKSLGDKVYDIILCTGVLMYLEEREAARVVKDMLKHSRHVLILSGPACRDLDNRHLEYSVIRKRDGSFIHNLDSMVEKAGGKVSYRRWEGNRVIDGHTIYLVFAVNSSGTKTISK